MEAAAQSKSPKKRVRSVARHRSFKLSKQRLTQSSPLPSVRSLLRDTRKLIWQNKRLFLGLALIYAVITFLFVQGAGSSFKISELKQNLDDVLGTNADRVGTTAALFGYLLSSAGTSVGEAAGVYQIIMIIVFSLAVIWAVRQVQAGEKPGIRDTLYKGMYPLIPFITIIFIIALQLIPLLIGNVIYATVLQNDLATSSLEKVLWLLIFILLALLSLYMVISSIFSLYIATLPDMRPIKALRSARELVLHRRWSVALRFIALPIVLALMVMAIFIPLLLVVPQITEALFLLATSIGLVIFHVYTYLLYRSLL